MSKYWEVNFLSIGERIKEQRLLLNLNQDDLSQKLNLTQRSISFYENDERVPPADILIKLSQIFNVTTDYLLGLSDDDSSLKNLSRIVVSKEEEQFIVLLRKLDKDYKDIVLGELKKCVKLQEQEIYIKKKGMPTKKQA